MEEAKERMTRLREGGVLRKMVSCLQSGDTYRKGEQGRERCE